MEQEDAARLFSALSQETRLAVVRRLVRAGRAGCAAGDLAEGLGVAPATLSFHLKELTHAGLVSSRREGRSIRYAAELDRVSALARFLLEECCAEDADPAADCRAVPACAPARTREPQGA